MLLCLGASLLSGCGDESYLEQASAETAEKTTEEETTEESQSPVSGQTIYVHVEGAVASPGVYELAEGSRVYEAIELAGGLLENAVSKELNQARELTDGEKLYIYTVGEETSDAAAADDGRVNINTADVDELTTLTGIGETRAQEIISYRESNGAFSSTEDLMNVSGIGEATYAKLQDQIKVN